MHARFFKFVFSLLLLLPLNAFAELPWQHNEHTRFLALGDSLTAGYGADPTLNGYAYQLYKQGVFDKPVHTLFANAAVPGTTSSDVRNYQLPQVERFYPDVIVMTVGGNDLIAVLEGRSDPVSAIGIFQENLTQTLLSLCQRAKVPNIYASNIYNITELGAQVNYVVSLFNQVTEGVIAGVAASGCPVNLADVNSAFAGRKGLLLIERNGADSFEVHLTNAGHKVMADAFKKAINR